MSLRKVQDKVNQVMYNDNARKAFGLALGALALFFSVGSLGVSTQDVPHISG